MALLRVVLRGVEKMVMGGRSAAHIHRGEKRKDGGCTNGPGVTARSLSRNRYSRARTSVKLRSQYQDMPRHRQRGYHRDASGGEREQLWTEYY